MTVFLICEIYSQYGCYFLREWLNWRLPNALYSGEI